MAKQFGIHQLRGKVGEHSYYRQTGVQGGLVRSINPAMSSRVKTDEAFANTRLNNAEFGQGGRIASVLARYINPKYRPMVLPFSQSKMARILLEYIKTNSAAWGERNLTPQNIPQASVDALNSVAKNRFEDFGLSVVGDTEALKITFESTTVTNAKMSAIGANTLLLRLVACSPWIGTFVAGTGKYAESFTRGNIYDEDFTFPSGASTVVDIVYNFPSIPPAGWPAETGVFFVAILMPVRTINGVDHILQEHCTYKAFLEDDGALV